MAPGLAGKASRSIPTKRLANKRAETAEEDAQARRPLVGKQPDRGAPRPGKYGDARALWPR